MRIIIEEDYQMMSKKASSLVSSQILLKPHTVLGLATGETPIGMYKYLIKKYKNGEIDFSKVTTFNLDEYYDLSYNNPQSYHYYMDKYFFNEINIKNHNIYIPDGMTNDINQECEEYENKIRECMGIDLQVLGIGSNGHIGFNEPNEFLNVATNLVNLSSETIEANSRFFDSKKAVPKKAISVGMSTILKANRIVLLASGENKARAIKNTINGKINTYTPSSLLQTHPNVTLVIDKSAAKFI